VKIPFMIISTGFDKIIKLWTISVFIYKNRERMWG
jgi:hypothetical protein